MDETYHSSYGAIQESMHVFILAGINKFMKLNTSKKTIKIFEVGFGTGLNAILAYRWALENQINIYYTSIENNPLSMQLIKKLNYGEILNQQKLFIKIHSVPWEADIIFTHQFQLQKINGDFISYDNIQGVDIVFYDAFAPGKQPAMWQLPQLQKCYEMLGRNGIFVTYSAKGQLKRDLRGLGYSVETLPGPPGKLQMLRATKISC